jgi:hypothetical protein
MTMRVCIPLAIDDTNSTSNIPDPDTSANSNDPALWSSSSYVVGDRRTYAVNGIHYIYQCQAAISGNKPPPSYPTEWLYVSAVNAHKMFDLSNTSQTSYPALIDVTVTPAQVVNTLALFRVDATSVRITVTDPTAGTVYDVTHNMRAPATRAGFYEYLFDPIAQKTDLIVTIPSYRFATVRVRIYNTASNAKCGTMLLGRATVISDGIHLGASVGIQDYSRKERDIFGEYNFIERSYADRANFTMWVENTQLDSVKNILAGVRATPTLYIGSDNYTSTAVFGFYKDFDLNITYDETTVCTLQLEGLV